MYTLVAGKGRGPPPGMGGMGAPPGSAGLGAGLIDPMAANPQAIMAQQIAAMTGAGADPFGGGMAGLGGLGGGLGGGMAGMGGMGAMDPMAAMAAGMGMPAMSGMPMIGMDGAGETGPVATGMPGPDAMGAEPPKKAATEMKAVVRFETAEHGKEALATLNGYDFWGSTLTCHHDLEGRDPTKVHVYGFPADLQWDEVKEFCEQVGTVAFCELSVHDGEIPQPAPMDPVAYAAAGQPPAMQQPPPNMDGGRGDGGRDRGGGDEGGGRKRKRRGFDDDQPVMGDVRPPVPQGTPGLPPPPGPKPSAPLLGGNAAFQAMLDKKRAAAATVTTKNGEVRYERGEDASTALAQLNGDRSLGGEISVTLSPVANAAGTRLVVTGIPRGASFVDLKDLFSRLGPVAFASCE